MQGNTDLLPLAPGREPSGRGGAGRSPLRRLADGLGRQARAVARHLSGFTALERAAGRLPYCDSPQTWAAASLALLDIRVSCTGEDLGRIPVKGPVIFYANHPGGALDGLLMAALCGRARPDLKIIVNAGLLRLPQLAPLAPMLLPLDLTGEDRVGNGASLRRAVRHLRQGGALGIFPSGHVTRWKPGRGFEEQPWDTLLARLGLWSKDSRPGQTAENAPLYIPLHVEAAPDPLFLAAACLREELAAALLPRVLWRQRGTGVALHVGEPLREQVLTGLDPEQRIQCLSLYRRHLAEKRRQAPRLRAAGTRRHAPLAPAADRNEITTALAEFSPGNTLVREGRYSVYLMQGDDCPVLLDEVTRRREESFRALGEGTGKPRDTDRYDRQYEHLLLIDEEGQRLAGAYRARLVRADGTGSGRGSLYTASLFHYDPEFFRQCGNALELGRAFVCPEYQREYAPLMLLWKGIARLALLRGTGTLFGPASMGLDYGPCSVDMLWRHLRMRHWHAPLAAFVRGRRPRVLRRELPFARHMDYSGVNALVRQMEGGRNLPILFKHYLQLGGRIAAFHEDRAFGTLDALLVVDLLNAPEKQLRRFMGEEGMAALHDGMWYT
ncbi:lysophospholipid acyltransferase family protein [Desulfovibrio sp.]|uniref:lysophospholipid acyltransferase family protein n=1 Tax=Desulfovibrio sp. TaxID=885 RepID=UPI0025C298BD|nr:lysophospholipid acyltransferase family protein [Desulfovibrio sp.]